MSIKDNEKSLKTQYNLIFCSKFLIYKWLFKLLVWWCIAIIVSVYLHIAAILEIETSSMAPIELYIKMSLMSNESKNILASCFESFSKDPNPSVSKIHIFLPYFWMGFLIILIPWVQACVVELTSKQSSPNKELSKKLLPVRYSPHATITDIG